jgi:serine protease Do
LDTRTLKTARGGRRAEALAIAAEAAARARPWLRLAARAALTMLALLWAQQAFARSAPESFADLVDQVLPAVVNVSSTQKVPHDQQQQDLEEMFRDFLDRRGGQEPDQQRPHGGTSLGSGFIIDPAGYIVTNNHVIEDADEITANFADGTVAKAKILGIDDKTDLAVLKVEVDHPLPAADFGDSRALRTPEEIRRARSTRSAPASSSIPTAPW